MFLHHANLFLGKDIQDLPIDDIYKEESEDVTLFCIDNFGIDDARDLTRQSLQRPVRLEKRVFIVCANRINSEAQNALLKLFEEPPETAVFYLVIPKVGELLPTLLSRLSILESETSSVNELSDVFIKFQSAGYGERLEMIASFAKAKDMVSMESIMCGAEIVGHTKRNPSVLQMLALVRSYFGARGASNKMLLEELALVLPRS